MAELRNQEFKIYVLEDSNLNRASVVEILTSEGFNVVGESGEATTAIKEIQSSEPHLIILDIVLPKQSGIEVMAFIQENINRNMMFLCMSSLSSEFIIIEAISAGAKDFLEKPFTKTQLLRSVEKFAAEFHNNR